MAIKRMVVDGFGQLELNQVAFRRDGRIEAQCALDAEDFATMPAENGMILAVDNVSRTIKLPVEGSELPVALNYTAEHMYDSRKAGLKNFKLDIEDGFYPRLGYLDIGDKFTTNCIAYNTEEFKDEDAIEAAYEAVAETALYGTTCENGAILVTKTMPENGLVLKAVTGTGAGSMPDGQFAIKFQVVKL